MNLNIRILNYSNVCYQLIISVIIVSYKMSHWHQMCNKYTKLICFLLTSLHYLLRNDLLFCIWNLKYWLNKCVRFLIPNHSKPYVLCIRVSNTFTHTIFKEQKCLKHLLDLRLYLTRVNLFNVKIHRQSLQNFIEFCTGNGIVLKQL